MTMSLDVLSGLADVAPPTLHTPKRLASQTSGDPLPDFDEYERVVVFTSGGKDSTACVLHLLDLGVPKAKIELHQG